VKVLFFVENVIVEPLGILYLATPLIRKGHAVRIVQIDRERSDTVVKNEGPFDIFCFSVITGSEDRWCQHSRSMKAVHHHIWRTEPASIFGGPHPTFHPEMADTPGVDIVVRGEAEAFIVEIVEAATSVGLRVRDCLVRMPIDDIAPPTRSILYDRYPYIRHNTIHNFISERGCPHHCAFCFNKAWNKLHSDGAVVRVRDPRLVVEEIRAVKADYSRFEYPWFVCDNFFGGDRGKLEEFQRAYAGTDLPLFVSARADRIDEDYVKLLKSCNVRVLNLAIEAANDRTRNEILQKCLSKDAVVHALDLLDKYGIAVRLQNIVGLPVAEALEDALETLKFNVDHLPKAGVSWSSILQPYAGTDIASYAYRYGFQADCAFVYPSFFDGSPMLIDHRTEIERLHKWWPLVTQWRWLFPGIRGLIRLPIPMSWLRKLWLWARNRGNDRLFRGVHRQR